METNFKVRNTNISDYEEMKIWWKYFRFPIPPLEILPDNFSDGMMISYKGLNLCSGFIYRTSSSNLFWMEWIVSNPQIKDRLVRKEGKEMLIKGLIYMAQKMGAKVIYTSVIQPNLKKDLLNCGFVNGSKNASELILNLT